MFLYSMINHILIAAAIIPAIFLLVYVYRADRLEPEPPTLLLRLIFYGIAATLFALAAEHAGSLVLGMFFGKRRTRLYYVLFFGCVVALAEEGAKYYLLKKSTWNHPAFDCQFDGVVYAVFVSMGFALWENITYVMRYGLGTALIRAVTAVPGHACFGVFMGVFYGLAKRKELRGEKEQAGFCRLLALFIPVLAHGTYDYIAAVGSRENSWYFIAFVAFLFLTAFHTVRVESGRDAYL